MSAPLLLCVASLTALGLPGIDGGPFYLLAVACLFRALADRRGILRAAALGFGFGCIVFLELFASTITWGIHVPFALALGSALTHGVPLALCAWFALSFEDYSARVLALFATWLVYCEVAAALGVMLSDSVLANSTWLFSSARYLGDVGLSTFLICISAAIAWAPTMQTLARQTLMLSTCAWLPLLVSHPASPEQTIRVAVPQGDVRRFDYALRVLQPSVARAVNDRFERLFVRAHEADLIVTTEQFDGASHALSAHSHEQFSSMARSERAAVLVATSGVDEHDLRATNTVLAWNPEGAFVGEHRKWTLAPLGEAALSPGDSLRPLPLFHEALVGVQICAEAMDARVARTLTRRGATLLVTTTSDTSFEASPLVFTHLAFTRLRSAEYGRDGVWASNGGPSGHITRDGAFHTSQPWRTSGLARMEVALFHDEPAVPAQWARVLLLVLSCLALRDARVAQRLDVKRPNTPLFWGLAMVMSAAITWLSWPLTAWRNDAAMPTRTALLAPLTHVESTVQNPYERFANSDAELGARHYLAAYFGVADVEFGERTLSTLVAAHVPVLAHTHGAEAVVLHGDGMLFYPKTGAMTRVDPSVLSSVLAPTVLAPRLFTPGQKNVYPAPTEAVK